MKGSLELLLLADDDDSDECSDEWPQTSEDTASFNSDTMHRVSLSSSCSSHKREKLSKVEKTTAVLKRAMTDKRERWQSKEWYRKTESRWQQPAGSEGGQSSHDTWDISRPR